MAAVRAEQLELRKVTFKENATRNRERMIAAGIKRYRWSTSCDERVCEYCRGNQGKTFDIRSPTAHGYPGEVSCSNGQACRCIALPLIEGVDY
jgi:SPP1 gp7 family putative phage head morphogenesis protein